MSCNLVYCWKLELYQVISNFTPDCCVAKATIKHSEVRDFEIHSFQTVLLVSDCSAAPTVTGFPSRCLDPV